MSWMTKGGRSRAAHFIKRGGHYSTEGTQLEREVRALLDGLGCVTIAGWPDKQTRVETPRYRGEWALRPDFVVRPGHGGPIAVLADGPHHATRRQDTKADRKDLEYAAIGWRVVHVWFFGMRTKAGRAKVALELASWLVSGAQSGEVGL